MFKSRGFSLIELMIVVAILGILVAVALPQFTSMTNDAKVAKAKESASTLVKALIMYNNTTPKPAKKLEELVPKQMQKIPDDPWGNKFHLDAELGMIVSYGADAQEGTIDDISISYLPPLMPQSAQFVDAGDENPGFVGISDEIVLTFTRPINDNPAPVLDDNDWVFKDNNGNDITGVSVEYYDGTINSGAPTFGTGAFFKLDDVDLRKVIIVLGADPLVTPGSMYINLKNQTTSNIRDMSKDSTNTNGKPSQRAGSALLLRK